MKPEDIENITNELRIHGYRQVLQKHYLDREIAVGPDDMTDEEVENAVQILLQEHPILTKDMVHISTTQIHSERHVRLTASLGINQNRYIDTDATRNQTELSRFVAHEADELQRDCIYWIYSGVHRELRELRSRFLNLMNTRAMYPIQEVKHFLEKLDTLLEKLEGRTND